MQPRRGLDGARIHMPFIVRRFPTNEVANMNSAEPPRKGPESLPTLPGFRAWLFGMIGVTLVFALQPLYPTYIGPLSNVLPTACATTAFLSSFVCMKRYGFGLRLNFEAVWFLFTLGMGLWAVAEGTWAFYYFVLKVAVPYPSLADIFYIAGYLPIIAGLLGYLDTFHEALTRRRLGLALVFIGIAVALALSFVLPIELAQKHTISAFLTDMTYPVLDLVLLSLTVLSLAIFAGGTIAKWWVLFGIASALYVIGDEFFLYQVAQGSYYNGSVDDLIFLLGYLTFALAFYVHRKEF